MQAVATESGRTDAGGTGDERAEDQSEAVRFLRAPATYGSPVDVVETHCSMVFLAGERGFKLKRAVRYGALDYRNLEQRAASCRAELVLNRRTAPDLYLGIRAITRGADGVVRWDGDGVVLDWVVEMQRFEQSQLLDRMVDADRISLHFAAAVGEEVGRFHRDAVRRPDHGGADAIGRAIAGNHAGLLTSAVFEVATVERLHRASAKALDAARLALERRREAGFVREGHGDLRLANICAIHGRPVLFDCVEFSIELSAVDVLYDLAFLLMDLDVRGRPDLSAAVLQGYLSVTEDRAELDLLPLFLSVRAATRAHLLASGLAQRDPAEAERHLRDAQRHAEAALRFLEGKA